MDLGLRDKVCLVTGASSAFERATAVMLAAEGAQVFGTARSAGHASRTAGARPLSASRLMSERIAPSAASSARRPSAFSSA